MDCFLSGIKCYFFPDMRVDNQNVATFKDDFLNVFNTEQALIIS